MKLLNLVPVRVRPSRRYIRDDIFIHKLLLQFLFGDTGTVPAGTPAVLSRVPVCVVHLLTS